MEFRTRLILDTFSAFEPDAVLIDHMPVGALGELKPTLDLALGWHRPPRLYLGLRDVLEDEAVIREAWRDVGAYDYLRCFDAALIYGDKEIYESARAYALEDRMKRIFYCNYVSPPPSETTVDLGPDEPYVLVTGGGGHDAFPLASAFLDAVPTIRDELGLRGVILAGPTMPSDHREAILARANGTVGVTTAQGGADAWVRGASAVITMGGYNSICEVMRWHKKALIVPRSGPSAEQRTRAKLLAEKRIVAMLDPSELSAARLAGELARLLSDDGIPEVASIPLLNGAGRAAEIILGGVSQSEAAPAAREEAASSTSVRATWLAESGWQPPSKDGSQSSEGRPTDGSSKPLRRFFKTC
jgi:predicted glycosyltransferase